MSLPLQTLPPPFLLLLLYETHFLFLCLKAEEGGGERSEGSGQQLP